MTAGGVTSVWRRLCSVQGVTTEILGLSAATGSPRLQVVVIPGNPGSAGYFKPFMRSLYDMLAGEADVLAVTHAGHDPATQNGGRLWSLSEQVAHKAAFLREQVLLPGRPPVVLVGHSIGAAMMVKAVAELEGLRCSSQQSGQQQQQAQGEEERGGEVGVVNPLAQGGTSSSYAAAVAAGSLPPIIKLVAVFPFFETNFPGNARQRRLRLLAPYYDLLGWVGAAVTALPLPLRRGFVRINAGDMDADAVELTARLLDRHAVRNAFYLAGHEFKDLSSPWDWALLSELGGRLHVMGCAADTWLSREQYEDMRERVPGMQATWHPDLRHAFCVSERQSAEAAEHIVSNIIATQPCLRTHAAHHLPAQARVPARGLAGYWGSSATLAHGSGSGSGSGTHSAVSVSHATGASSSSSGTSSGGGAGGGDDAATSLPFNHQPPHGDQHAVLYGQTSRQRQQLYGDDVASSLRRDAVAFAAGSGAAGGLRGGVGDVEVSADQVELDIEMEIGGTAAAARQQQQQLLHRARHQSAPGEAVASAAVSGKQHASVAGAAAAVTIVAGSGAAATAAGGSGVVTRSMARRQAGR